MVSHFHTQKRMRVSFYWLHLPSLSSFVNVFVKSPLCSLTSSFSYTADICSLSTVCPTRSASYQFKGGVTVLAVIHFSSGPQQRSHIGVTPVKLIKLSVSGTWGTRFSKYLRHVKIFSWITIICQNITSVACFLLLLLSLSSVYFIFFLYCHYSTLMYTLSCIQ